MTDADLIQRALSGDSDAFGDLIVRHQGAVQALAYHTLGSFDDARDASQETFVHAYLKLDQLRDVDRFAGWLRTIALNRCRSLRRGRKETVPLDEVSAPVDETTPCDGLLARESRESVHRALRMLTDRNRLVITLRYLGGMSYRDIAGFLDVPLSTVEGRMHRAKQELRGRLMESVEKDLKGEQLPEEFAKNVLDEALKRAREARQRWDRDAFVRSCEQAMEAAARLQDGPSQVDVLQMMGEAETSWLGKPEKAVEDYELALKVAREHQTRASKGEVDILKSLYLAHLRHGEYDRAGERAQEAMERSRALRDITNEALAQGALDLTSSLPDSWRPGQRGGYAVGAFRAEQSDAGLTFCDPVGVRNYTFGGPSRATAFIHLLVPRRLFGPSVEVGASWGDEVEGKLEPLGWTMEAAESLVAQTAVEASTDTVVTPAGRFEGCVRLRTEIGPEHSDRAADIFNRAYCGTRTMWFAPGVGLVKLRHRDQDDNAWTVWLAGFGGEAGDGLFPLETGRWWRYRWCADAFRREFFDDLCRVVDADNGFVTLSSAACATQPSEEESAARLSEEAELERQSDDPAGEAAALEAVVLASKDRGAKAERKAWLERLAALYEGFGDEWRLADTRCRLADLREEGVLASLAQYEEQLAVARRLGEPLHLTAALELLGLKQREAEQHEASVKHLEEAARMADAAGET